MLQSEKNKKTIGILQKLKQAGPPGIKPIAPLGDFDVVEDIDAAGKIVPGSVESLKKAKKKKKPAAEDMAVEPTMVNGSY